MSDNGNEPATKSDIMALRMEIREGFASKDDLQHFATKDDLQRFATKDEFRGLCRKVANLTGEIFELNQRLPGPDYFSRLMQTMDGIAKNLENQNERLTTQSQLWKDLLDKTADHAAKLGDHEHRISRLES